MELNERERKITEELEILIPKHLVGYKYLKSAILLAIDSERIDLKNDIYVKVANEYAASSIREVESRIKTAIESGFAKKIGNFEDFFGRQYINCCSPARFIKAFVKKFSPWVVNSGGEALQKKKIKICKIVIVKFKQLCYTKGIKNKENDSNGIWIC